MNRQFRLVRRKGFGGNFYYGLAEVYYDEQGNVEYYCYVDYDIADSPEEIRESLEMRLKAFEEATLEGVELDSIMRAQNTFVEDE